MAKVKFHYNYKPIPVKRKGEVKRFIEHIFNAEGFNLVQLSYIFCSDEFLYAINKQFLNHDTYTDVITFTLSDNNTEIIGESYLSLDRILENSKTLNVPYTLELIRVIFHSALHLCGYKDKTKSEISQMRNKEDHYLRLFEINTST